MAPIVDAGPGANPPGLIFFTEFDNGNSGTADEINWNNSQKHLSTLTDNVTYTFVDPPGSCNLLLRVVQDGGGGNTAVWPATVDWPGGTAPTITSAGGSIDIVSFYFDAPTGRYSGQFAQNFS